MTSRNFFINQLNATIEALEWSYSLDDSKNADVPPFDSWCKRLFPENEMFSRLFGTWSRLRIIFHLSHYEEHLALPSMKMWIGDEPPRGENIPKEEEIWKEKSNHKNLIIKLQKLRKEQVNLIKKLNDDQWKEVKPTFWGDKSIEWIVSKTIQHSFEHGSKMILHGLFWEGMAEMIQKTTLLKKEKGEEIDEEALREVETYINKKLSH